MTSMSQHHQTLTASSWPTPQESPPAAADQHHYYNSNYSSLATDYHHHPRPTLQHQQQQPMQTALDSGSSQSSNQVIRSTPMAANSSSSPNNTATTTPGNGRDSTSSTSQRSPVVGLVAITTSNGGGELASDLSLGEQTQANDSPLAPSAAVQAPFHHQATPPAASQPTPTATTPTIHTKSHSQQQIYTNSQQMYQNCFFGNSQATQQQQANLTSPSLVENQYYEHAPASNTTPYGNQQQHQSDYYSAAAPEAARVWPQVASVHPVAHRMASQSPQLIANSPPVANHQAHHLHHQGQFAHHHHHHQHHQHVVVQQPQHSPSLLASPGQSISPYQANYTTNGYATATTNSRGHYGTTSAVHQHLRPTPHQHQHHQVHHHSQQQQPIQTHQVDYSHHQHYAGHTTTAASPTAVVDQTAHELYHHQQAASHHHHQQQQTAAYYPHQQHHHNSNHHNHNQYQSYQHPAQQHRLSSSVATSPSAMMPQKHPNLSQHQQAYAGRHHMQVGHQQLQPHRAIRNYSPSSSSVASNSSSTASPKAEHQHLQHPSSLRVAPQPGGQRLGVIQSPKLHHHQQQATSPTVLSAAQQVAQPAVGPIAINPTDLRGRRQSVSLVSTTTTTSSLSGPALGSNNQATTTTLSPSRDSQTAIKLEINPCDSIDNEADNTDHLKKAENQLNQLHLQCANLLDEQQQRIGGGGCGPVLPKNGTDSSASNNISTTPTSTATSNNNSNSANTNNNNNNGGRSKRLRTSFKHNQLKEMKRYFATNQNPDANNLKTLAQTTGLSKRVLQVWFQNARAKHRRNTARQANQQLFNVVNQHTSHMLQRHQQQHAPLQTYQHHHHHHQH